MLASLRNNWTNKIHSNMYNSEQFRVIYFVPLAAHIVTLTYDRLRYTASLRTLIILCNIGPYDGSCDNGGDYLLISSALHEHLQTP